MDCEPSGKMGGLRRLAVSVAVGAIYAVSLAVGAFQGGGVASAATGDQLRQFTAAIPPCSVGTGLAFDGTNLIKSCLSSNTLWYIDPADGSQVDAVVIAGASDIRAMAFDGSRNKLWVCEGYSSVYLVDLTALTGTSAFTTTNGCMDGLAYDGVDDTIWASGDAVPQIEHYTTAGALIASFDLTGKLGGYGNSGIAVGGDKLYLANNGGSQIYQCTKDLVTCTLMSTFPQRLEDLECDNVTFAPKGAVWVQDAYDNILNAYEIPAGTCDFGGAAGNPPSEVPTSVATPCIQGIVNSRCPKNPPVSKVTPAPTATAVPPTAVPPTQAPPAPAPTRAGGGAAGVISAPDTGSGPGGQGIPTAALLVSAALLLGGLAASTAALRRR